MTEYRQEETTTPVREQILAALRDSAQVMVTGNGYFYDYTRCEIADEGYLSEFYEKHWGNSLLIFDGGEEEEQFLRTDVDEPRMDLEIQSIVHEQGDLKFYQVTARMIADQLKWFKVFRDAQNGDLIGPARITRKDPYPYGDNWFLLSCTAFISYQHDDGDATQIA